MKSIMFLILLLFSQLVFGNNLKEYFGYGNFVIEGKIINYPEIGDGKIQILIEDYIEQNLLDVQINKDGSFNAEIPVTDIQDVSFYLDETFISFFSFKNDTVRIKFAYDNPLQTLELAGVSENRNKDLALCLALSQYSVSYPQTELINSMFNPVFSDLERAEKLNQHFRERAEIINGFISENQNTEFKNKFLYDAYYETCRIASYAGRKYLQTINNLPDGLLNSYNVLNEDIFRISSEYRNYLSRYIFMNGLSPYEYAISVEESGKEEISALRREYYYALSQIIIPAIRDWYITQRCMAGFVESELGDVRFVLEDFKTICQNEKYIKKLEEVYSDILVLHNAVLAPGFKLKNEKGEIIALSDFAGKIVYLDFWDSYCAPCIHEFKNYDKKFHQKYERDEIIHIYICFSNDEKRWKENIKKYDLQGVNLITEAQKDNSLYRDYVFSFYPHYVLIDRNGKIYKNGCERPSEMLGSKENTLDKLLKINPQ